MLVNSHQWQQFRDCCRDEAAFTKLQNLLNLTPPDAEPAAAGANSPFCQLWMDAAEDAIFICDRQLRYTQINRAASAALGLSLSEVAGKTHRELFGFGDESLELGLRQVLELGEPLRVNHKLSPRPGAPPYNCAYTAVRDEEGAIVGLLGICRPLSSMNLPPRLDPAPRLTPSLKQRYGALSHVIASIRESLDLQTIFNTTSTEVRQLLDADRVAVFRLDPESGYNDGEFVSEDLLPPFYSALQAKIHDHCFGEQFAIYYQQGRIQAIADVETFELSDCHRDILTRFQVRANLVVPLLKTGQLWGLLCIHQCRGPRQWQPDEIDFIREIAGHLGVAIGQAELLARTRSQLEQRKALVAVIRRIREPMHIDEIFVATVREIRGLLGADRVGVFRFYPESHYDDGEFIAEDVAPGVSSALGVPIHDHCFGERFSPGYQKGKISAISDIYAADLSDCHLEILGRFQVRANLVVPLLKHQTLWGLVCIHQCDRPRPWTEEEIDFIVQIARHLEVALQQAEYVARVQAQNTQLAIAQERQREMERQQIQAAIVDKIRQSLDIDSIFNTTTAEVRHLFKADRVAVYRFHPDWSGSFVAESRSPEWKPLVGTMPAIADDHLQGTEGGRYRRHETFAVDDIYTAGHQDCHVRLLEEFQARAYAIAPIFQANRLWGLLAAYQNSRPRRWEDYEIRLLAQIGVQFGVALQQAELLAQTRRQAEALARDLRHTQTQLVQSEKMSSLGQLVAGIAHEINNPVNFIYGNLDYAADYCHDLLDLVELYRKEYPDPTPALDDRIEEIELDFLTEDLPKILSSMKVGTDRIRKLVLSLRNFSRLDEADIKSVDIHQGIDSTLLILGHRFKAKPDRPPIEVVKEYGRLPRVECYVAQLNQVFMNVLSNAIDALEATTDVSDSDKPPTIAIATSLQPAAAPGLGDRVVIAIRDNGPGIPPEVQPQIFDPFFTTKSVGKGTGLGLSISYQIVVDKHGGAIECASGPEGGTEFRILIPVAQRR
ncbi:GAF domain-containing protein [Lyngbya sp. CCY1209]|uniref:GAF domain-containing protein n=1 Tax=Lyngbya sp. CCY1209 TaxID=2886103 RepID=UPI002D216CC0|nr:GAF domain-containing protein [Lyngbya sp. CCY1209]MEB3884317.1 GAF domain-containing protein [Lyngbya sp. CCY1209]